MHHVEVRVITKDESGPIFPEITRGDWIEGTLGTVAFLESGMLSGKTSVMMKVTLPNKKIVIVQTSGEILTQVAAALSGALQRFGDTEDQGQH